MSTSKHFSSKWTEQSELYLDWRDSKQYARKCESISSILPVVSTIIATVCRTVRHYYLSSSSKQTFYLYIVSLYVYILCQATVGNVAIMSTLRNDNGHPSQLTLMSDVIFVSAITTPLMLNGCRRRLDWSLLFFVDNDFVSKHATGTSEYFVQYK